MGATNIQTEPRSSLTSAGFDYWTMSFLLLTPVIGIVGTALYTIRHGFHLWMLILAVTMYAAVGMSICAGYHRFYSHKSYEASRPLQIFYAIFGAMAAQNSILCWSSSHRIHHQYVDRDWDPYNIKRGFWWAHILWIFYRHPAPDAESNAPDLLRNPVVRWQNRWYHLILFGGGFGIPLAVGVMFGDPVAGLLWGGFLRLTVIHHTTFFVNSLAHSMGEPVYNAEVSACDNWCVALLTLGEGYHSFHHRFPADFRNGIHWYQWDPAKWFITTLRSVGLARDLRSTPPAQVEHARMSAALRMRGPAMAGAREDLAARIREVIGVASRHLDTATALWQQHLIEREAAGVSTWRATRRKARQQIREARRRWSAAMRELPRSRDAAVS